MKLTSSFSWIPSAALVLSCSSPAASIATDAASSSDVGSSDAARRDSASGKSDAGAESRVTLGTTRLAPAMPPQQTVVAG